MSSAQPVRCQKCGKPVGYVTVLAKGMLGLQQPLQNVKVVAICMDCRRKASSLCVLDGVNPQSFYGYPFLSRLGDSGTDRCLRQKRRRCMVWDYLR